MSDGKMKQATIHTICFQLADFLFQRELKFSKKLIMAKAKEYLLRCKTVE